MRTGLIAVLIAFAGCASAPAPPDAFLHDDFARRRPAMVALEAKGPAEFHEAIYRGLIEKDYSVLAEGEPPGPTGGTVRASTTGAEPTLKGTLTMLSPEGTRLFEAEARARTLDELTERLLTPLPRK